MRGVACAFRVQRSAFSPRLGLALAMAGQLLRPRLWILAAAVLLGQSCAAVKERAGGKLKLSFHEDGRIYWGAFEGWNDAAQCSDVCEYVQSVDEADVVIRPGPGGRSKNIKGRKKIRQSPSSCTKGGTRIGWTQ